MDRHLFAFQLRCKSDKCDHRIRLLRRGDSLIAQRSDGGLQRSEMPAPKIGDRCVYSSRIACGRVPAKCSVKSGLVWLRDSFGSPESCLAITCRRS
jgi:hypothetical protein